MKKYILVDSSNLFFRSIGASYNCSIDLKVGLSLNIFLNSLNSANKIFNPDHFVICLDNKSWRYDYYEKYKLMRRKKFLELTGKEKEENEILMSAYKDLINFFEDKTNMTVLNCERLEADDLISFWINIHKNDENIILSLDSDFVQLLGNENTKIFNSNKNIILTKNGCFNLKNQPIDFHVDSKGKVSFRENGEKKRKKKTSSENIYLENNFSERLNEKDDTKKYWYEWALFLKIMRGDLSDGIESVVPNVKKGILEKVFNDRIKKGFEWKSFMYREIEEDNKRVRIIDRYKFNKMMIDLNSQPDDIKELGYSYINSIERKNKSQIGFHFLKFCNKYELRRIEENSVFYTKFLAKSYEK